MVIKVLYSIRFWVSFQMFTTEWGTCNIFVTGSCVKLLYYPRCLERIKCCFEQALGTRVLLVCFRSDQWKWFDLIIYPMTDPKKNSRFQIPSSLNLGIFVCSFQVFWTSKQFPSVILDLCRNCDEAPDPKYLKVISLWFSQNLSTLIFQTIRTVMQ